jgi:hypothetical protein
VSGGIFNVSLHMRRLTTYNRGVRDASGITSDNRRYQR